MSTQIGFGILQIDPGNVKEPPFFTESVTLEAMDKLGVTPDELVPLGKDDIKRVPGNEKVKAQIIADLERRRLDAIDAIKQTRLELIAEYARKASFDEKYRSKPAVGTVSAEMEYKQLQKAQKREIEQIIAIELQKKETKEKEIERQKKMDETVRMRDLANVQKRKEEAEKKKEQERKILERIAQRDIEIEETKEKQRKDEERRYENEQERVRVRKIEAAKQEVAKQEKLRKLMEERDRRSAEEQMRRDERERVLKAREITRQKTREEELAALREQHKRMMQKQTERMTLSQQREKEELERKIVKMQEDERLAQQRMIDHQKKKEELLTAVRRRNDERIMRSKELSRKIEEEDMVRKAAIQGKMLQAHERLNALTTEKLKKLELARREDNDKKVAAAERKRRAEELLTLRVVAFDRKMEEKELKFGEMKKRQEEEQKNKAAVTWYKMRVGEENAKRLERRQAYEKTKTLQTMEQRLHVVEGLIDQKKMAVAERQSLTQQMQMKKHKLIEDVSAMMGKGDPDIEGLAAQFGIDVDEVRRRFKARGLGIGGNNDK